MNHKDEQALAAINYTPEYDARVREQIKEAIERSDRAFLEQVVVRVIDRLQLKVPDVRGFVDTAYERFRDWF